LIEQEGTRISLTARGRLLSNEVFSRFLIEETDGQIKLVTTSPHRVEP
jgi:hypothetical protein